MAIGEQPAADFVPNGQGVTLSSGGAIAISVSIGGAGAGEGARLGAGASVRGRAFSASVLAACLSPASGIMLAFATASQ